MDWRRRRWWCEEEVVSDDGLCLYDGTGILGSKEPDEARAM
jgi:hypothetical protein